MQLTDAQPPANAQQQQNDSWFWENETSSTSSKKDGNGSPCEEADIDLTTIPLESNDHELMERLRRQVIERDVRLKSLAAENAELNEKLKISGAENQELNRNIEELDKQHQIAIEKVLDVKHVLQDKLNASLDENKLFQQQKAELLAAHQTALKAVEAEKESLRTQLDQHHVGHQELTTIAKNYELQIDELSDANLKLEAEVAELKASSNDAPEVIDSNDDCLKKINSLINANFKLTEPYENEDQFVGTFSKWLASTSGRIREMDFEMSKLIDENKLIKDEAVKHANDRDMIKSELEHIEVECSELMKNNNILMADIESLRGGKLETIIENDDEENIVVLEKQLEDSNVLNQSLEDEFQSIRTKLEATEVERVDYFNEIQQLKTQLSDNVSKCKVYQEEIESLENEKSNYLFELNELKSEEERNILQKELKLYKDRETELMTRLDELEKEHSALREKHEALERQSLSQIHDLSTSHNMAEEESSKKECQLTEALAELEQMRSVRDEMGVLKQEKLNIDEALAVAQRDRASLESRCEELTKQNDANLENLKKANELVQELQQKLLATTSTEELAAKFSALEEQLTAMTAEKENLIALVTTKHNENVQYHNEIVRLTQLLQQEAQKAESTQSEAAEALNDQVKFLREKSDLLAASLLQEQNSLRLLQQERNDAVELNSTLNKDIERLRQHLLEVADAYTYEQVSLQKQVEEYKGKLMAIEAEAKQSATAYTSANIRANQQTETLQSQYTLLTQQRDELLAKLGAAEDIDNKNQAALTNLQVALEIFQRGEKSRSSH